ncbi:unnamed protein product, partial [Prorocentrum cordatum]
GATGTARPRGPSSRQAARDVLLSLRDLGPFPEAGLSRATGGDPCRGAVCRGQRPRPARRRASGGRWRAASLTGDRKGLSHARTRRRTGPPGGPPGGPQHEHLTTVRQEAGAAEPAHRAEREGAKALALSRRPAGVEQRRTNRRRRRA